MGQFSLQTNRSFFLIDSPQYDQVWVEWFAAKLCTSMYLGKELQLIELRRWRVSCLGCHYRLSTFRCFCGHRPALQFTPNWTKTWTIDSRVMVISCCQTRLPCIPSYVSNEHYVVQQTTCSHPIRNRNGAFRNGATVSGIRGVRWDLSSNNTAIPCRWLCLGHWE